MQAGGQLRLILPREICQSFENRDEHARNAKDSCNFVHGDSTVENAVVLSYCLFAVSMFVFFCGSTKPEHYNLSRPLE